MHQILGNVIIIYSEDYKQWFIAQKQEVDESGCSQSGLMGYGNTREEALEMALENISISHQKQETIIRYLEDILNDVQTGENDMEWKKFDTGVILAEGEENDGYDVSYLNSICFDNGEYIMGAL